MPPETENNNQPEKSENPLLDALFSTVAPASEPEPEEGPGRTLSEALSADPEPKEEPKDPPKEEPKDPPKEEPKGEPEKPKVKVKKAEPPPPPPAPKAEPKAEAKPETDPFENELLEEEKDALAIARFAANSDPKHKGYDEKLLKFYKAHADFMKAARAKDPAYDFSEDNPEYEAWLRANKPQMLTALESRRIEREMIKAEARQEAAAEAAKVQAEMERRDRIPAVAREADDFGKNMVDDSVPPDLLKVLREEGVEKAKEAFPVEFDIADRVVRQAQVLSREFLELSNGIKTLDGNNPLHRAIVDFVRKSCDDFAANGGKFRIRNGKQFATREAFGKMTPDQKAAHWTFSNRDLLDIAKVEAKNAITVQIKQEVDRLEKMGYRRATPAPTQKQETEAPQAPRSRPSPAPGGGEKDDRISSNPVLSVLGLG